MKCMPIVIQDEWECQLEDEMSTESPPTFGPPLRFQDKTWFVVIILIVVVVILIAICYMYCKIRRHCRRERGRDNVITRPVRDDNADDDESSL